MTPYLSIGAVYRDEAPYLREWIEFHRLVGVERFFLYDNRSEDEHMEVLSPYIDSGLVVHHSWPAFPAHLQTYDDCIERHRHDSRWMAFIDIDEFLFSPTLRPVAEVLRDFEQYPGVAVNCLAFGTSGHETPPPGLVIDSYLRRTDRERRNLIIKSIVDPPRVLHVGRTSHYFRYRDHERAVNERGEPVRADESDSLSCDLLRINHYITKSQQERDRKLAGRRSDNGLAKPGSDGASRDSMLNEVEDRAILAYAPALREAMGVPAPA